MELFGKTLDTETQLLIAIGSAVAAGCQPFLTVLNFPRPYIIFPLQQNQLGDHQVYARGKKVSQWNGSQMEFTGKAGTGRFIKREPFEGF